MNNESLQVVGMKLNTRREQTHMHVDVDGLDTMLPHWVNKIAAAEKTGRPGSCSVHQKG
jgi:hypothetical protein